MTLPNFLIDRAAKAGTTTLHAYLRPHPGTPCRRARNRFFAYGGTGDDYSYPVKTLEEYEGYFAEAGDATAIGEANAALPADAGGGGADQGADPGLPAGDLAAQSGRPVVLGLSHGAAQRVGGAGDLLYLAAIAADPNFLRGYAADLENYFGLFDRAQFHIIRFEDLVRDPLAVAGALYGFLGVATDFTPAVERVANPGGLPKNRVLHSILANKRVMDFGKRFLPERLLEAAKGVRNGNLEKQRMAPEERAAAMAALRDDILRTGDLVGRISAWLRLPEAEMKNEAQAGDAARGEAVKAGG